MKEYNLAIIGAGASGLSAAINAVRFNPGIKIILLEHLGKAGKKILATGNGRCNMTNLNAVNHKYHNKDFANCAFKKYPPEKIIDFFYSLGLMTYTESDGRVYPRSNNASSVLDALRFSIDKSTDIITDFEIEEINIGKSGKFIINNEISTDKVLIAAGGKSSPSQGSDGSGYTIAKQLGHTVTPLYPALTALNANPSEVKSLKGIRAAGVSLTLRCDNEKYNSSGEILFTQAGISGIAAMELARPVGRHIKKGKECYLFIDFLPEISTEKLKNYLINILKSNRSISSESLLTGIIPKAIGISVIKKAGLSAEKIKSADITEISKKLAEIIKNYSLKITGTKSFNDSQVTSGGISTDEIDCKTMQSRLIKGLYFSGEIIDVDGGCGGFNLQWAFASGLLAGELND